MRNLLIILWLILIGVIAVPVCLDYMNGTPKDDVLSVIQRETETDDIRVTGRQCFHGWESGTATRRAPLETERNTLTCGWTRAGMCTSIT